MIHHVEVRVLVLLLIASLVGIVARRMRLPYTLALVLAGLGLGVADVHALDDVALDKELLLLLFLPALLFEAALHIDPREFRKELVPILTLAVPGVLVAVAVTAGVVAFALEGSASAPFGWREAFLFAAVISATDPVSVLALFSELGVPRRLYLLVEGESLLNDGVAVVVFVIVCAVYGLSGEAPLEGTASIVAYGLRTFVWMAAGGVLIGAIVGAAVSVLTRHVDDRLVEVTLTTIVAYGSFLLAETVHASGVLSTVAAGIVMGSFGRRYGMSVTTRVAMEDFWEYAAFLANSFVFLLVGLELDPEMLVRNSGAIAVAFGAVLAGRIVSVHLAAPLGARHAASIPGAWRHVMVWGGLRGSLSMVLALSLPASYPARETLVVLVFGVVAASLFLQGLSVGPLLRWLGLLGGRDERRGYERARLRVLAARDAVAALDRLAAHLEPAAIERLRAFYAARARAAEAEAGQLAGGDLLDEQLLEGLQELADVERETIRHAVAAGLVGPEVGAEVSVEIDERREALEHAHGAEAERREVLRRVIG